MERKKKSWHKVLFKYFSLVLLNPEHVKNSSFKLSPLTFRKSLWSKDNNQWLIQDGNNFPFTMLPPNFKITHWMPYLQSNFKDGLDDKDWFVRLKCCLFLPLATKYKAFTYVGTTGLVLVLKVTITYALF